MPKWNNGIFGFSLCVVCIIGSLCSARGIGMDGMDGMEGIEGIEGIEPTYNLARLSLNRDLISQPGKITKPEVAAQRLYAAWRRKNRRAASEVASKEAIHTLFASRWMAMSFKECDLNGADEGFTCRFVKGSSVLEMLVTGGASAGYGVQSVSLFSAAD